MMQGQPLFMTWDELRDRTPETTRRMVLVKHFQDAEREYHVRTEPRGTYHFYHFSTSTEAAYSDPRLAEYGIGYVQWWMTELLPGVFADRIVLPGKEVVVYQATPELIRLNAYLQGLACPVPLQDFVAEAAILHDPLGLRGLHDLCLVLGREFAVNAFNLTFMTWLRGTEEYSPTFLSWMNDPHVVVHRP